MQVGLGRIKTLLIVSFDKALLSIVEGLDERWKLVSFVVSLSNHEQINLFTSSA